MFGFKAVPTAPRGISAGLQKRHCWTGLSESSSAAVDMGFELNYVDVPFSRKLAELGQSLCLASAWTRSEKQHAIGSKRLNVDWFTE